MTTIISFGQAGDIALNSSALTPLRSRIEARLADDSAVHEFFAQAEIHAGGDLADAPGETGPRVAQAIFEIVEEWRAHPEKVPPEWLEFRDYQRAMDELRDLAGRFQR